MILPSTGPGPSSGTVTEALASRSAHPGIPRKVVIGLVIVGLVALVAIFAPFISPYDPLQQDVVNRLAQPSAQHWLGTDQLGRDVLSRLIYAARIDLVVGFLGALLPMALGTVLGAIAGYFGGWIDVVIMRIADLIQAFPVYILIIALVFALGPGAGTILISFTAIVWVIYARLIRDEILRVRGQDYVQAAIAAGLPSRRILARHVIPNTISQTVIYFAADILYAILALASFTFIGLGIPPPTPEWGAMIADGQSFLRDQWWLATAPGIAISITGLGFLLLGDGLDDWLQR